MMRRREVVLGGIATQLCAWGPESGQPVLCLPSAGLGAPSMAAFAAAVVPAGYRVFALDLRGHGGSAAEPAQVTLSGMADDVVELLGRLGTPPPRLLGISMGGVVAGLVARRAGVEIADLAVACSPDRGYPAFAERAVALRAGMADLAASTVQRWFTAEQRATGHPAVEEAHAALLGMDPAAWDAIWTDFARFGGWERPASSVPVRCYAGEHDASTPPEVVGRIAETLGAPCDVIAGAPHQLLMTHAEAFAAGWLPAR